MYAKVLTVAIVLSSTAGAGASYIQNHTIPWNKVWYELTAFQRGPLATETANSSNQPYRRSEYFDLCKRGFERKLSKLSYGQRQQGCICMDKAISSWSQTQQDRALFAFGQIQFDYGYDRYSAPKQRKQIGRKSQHQRNVEMAHKRSNWREAEREAKSYVQRLQGMNPIWMNPVAHVWSVDRLEKLAARCGIIGAPPKTLKEVEERYKTIGSPTS